MAGNDAIQLLRATREKIKNSGETLLEGQPLYNTTDRYLTVGGTGGSSTDSKPVRTREIGGKEGSGDDTVAAGNDDDFYVRHQSTGGQGNGDFFHIYDNSEILINTGTANSGTHIKMQAADRNDGHALTQFSGTNWFFDDVYGRCFAITHSGENYGDSTVVFGRTTTASTSSSYYPTGTDTTNYHYVKIYSHKAKTDNSTVILETSGRIQANSFYATSDKRLKENIKEWIPSASILDLPVVEYNFIGSTDKSVGCIAQDLQAIYPEFVSTGENGYLTINESKLVYPLINEVKKLRSELEELKVEIAELKSRVGG